MGGLSRTASTPTRTELLLHPDAPGGANYTRGSAADLRQKISFVITALKLICLCF